MFKRDGVDGNAHKPARIVTLYGTAAITEGDWVQIDTADTTYGLGYSVKQCTTGATSLGLALGVATQTTTAAGAVKVQVGGVYASANVADAVTAGQKLTVSTTAGRGSAIAAGDNDTMREVGVALEDGDGNNDADVLIYDAGLFPV